MSEPNRLSDEFVGKVGGAADQTALQGVNLEAGAEVLNKAYDMWNDMAWNEVLHVTGYDGIGLPGGSITWTYMPVRKVLITRSRSRLDPQRALPWAMQRLKEIKALCCQKKFTKYYRGLVKSPGVLDAKSPFTVAWKDGAVFWNS
eukprot:4997284-Pyramimonas_sp.AAC.1